MFRQIYLELRSAILSGALRPAAKLPSTRDLAVQLGVSRTAVVSAFEQLLAEGYAVGRKGAGTYVASDLPEPFAAPHGRKARAVPAAASAASFHGLGDFVDVTAQNDERPFNLGRTLLDARSAELWRKLTARTLRSFERLHLGYGDPRGMSELRKSVCDYLRAARGVRCEPDQIVITAGTQQAIDIVARVVPGPDKAVWIEDPGYPLTRLTLAASGAKVYPIPVDQHGVNVTEGIRRAPKARAVFITASHQFPTGVPLSMARRLELLAWSRESGAWIIEDDYASEFRYGGRPLASLQGLDEAGRVIYVGTLNKALFPGLRLGYAVLPDPLVQSFVAARYLMDRQPSSLCQSVVAAFMEEGHFAAHVRRMRDVYRRQRDTLVAALSRRLGDHLSVEPPDQGMHLVAYTRRGLSDVKIERAARDHGVVVRAMSRLYIEAPARSALMLGFSGYPQQTIAPAVARLAGAIAAGAVSG
ncbi:MocR-like pyridoxine biosynthesis transcription factor PdxR [Bradyrhizobium betae]|uniref:MocR-like pyridoxine biosynthesis transcription factor PdxR n=1 Tax=Bradyrhizobium betae TaxID=244734 RepID=UPI002167DB7E|nr:PLP-dependent aminotransferase family protein [Bradyrhizobium betae]MCS3730118.1 GntR family transcriptional regulator/MocR family aminotransferase [Bradyrhizobium betae]